MSRISTTGSVPKNEKRNAAELDANSSFTIFHLYDVELKNYLQDLNVLNSIYNKDLEEQTEEILHKARNLRISSSLMCTSCNFEFADHEEQRAHYKTDWHRYNLKQKIKGLAPVSATSFSAETVDNEMIPSKNGTKDKETKNFANKRAPPSSIPSHVYSESCSEESDSSSTDSEMESSSFEEENKSFKNLKLYFRNKEKKVLSLHRCVLFPKQNPPSHDGELIRMLCNIQEKLMWTIILVGGGRFAAATFDGKNVLQHKTFRRYTIRAKQGTSQSTKDKQNGVQTRSAGAGLRRHNEMALIQDIQTLLESWSDEIRKCDTIFYRAPGPNKNILFGGKIAILKKGDSRLRPIPFATGRATFQEVLRVHDVLNTVECFSNLETVGIPSTLNASPKNDPRKLFKGRKSKKGSGQEILRKSLSKQGPPTLEYFSADSSDAENFSLIEEDEVFSTSNLKMFEVTKKKKFRKRHKPLDLITGMHDLT